MLCSVNQDRSHGHSRTKITRRRHRADSISPGGTRGLGPNADQRGALPALGLTQCAGPIQGYGGRRPSSNGFRNRNPPLVAHATESIRCALRDLRPLAVSIVEPGSADLRLFNWPIEPLSLSRPSQHGRREHLVSGARPHGTAGGLRAVRQRRRGSARRAMPGSAGIAADGRRTSVS